VSPFSPGQRLHDRYALVERVGAGGMSEVWRATDELLGRTVAVKALVTPLAADPALGEPTWREARAAARLTHPHITQVHDYGEVPLPGGGSAGYLVMEYAEGQTLAELLAGGPLPWPEAARIGQQVAAALAAAHRLGVVHRDIKPGNVMLTDAGVKVLDFGIASVAGRADADPDRLVGTPRYAAPERLDTTAPARPPSDVYSLGALLYEALVGRPVAPLHTWVEAVAAHRVGVTVLWLSVPGLPEELTRWCQACLSPDPVRRPSAAELAAALSALPTAAPTLADPPADRPAAAVPTVAAPAGAAASAALPATRVEDVPNPARGGGRRLMTGIGAALALVLVGLGLALLITALRPGDPDGPGEAGAASPQATTGSPEAPTSSPPPATPEALAPQDVITALDQEITQAFDGDGTITRDAFDELEDEVDDLREALEEEPGKQDEKLRKAAEDLRKEIDELREDGEIDQATADTLTGLLEPLLGR
jgi:serine/threonine-protein kinase